MPLNYQMFKNQAYYLNNKQYENGPQASFTRRVSGGICASGILLELSEIRVN